MFMSHAIDIVRIISELNQTVMNFRDVVENEFIMFEKSERTR